MTVKLDGTNGLLQNYDYQVPTTGFSYTFSTANVLLMNPAGTLATGTITTPASPVDGMTITIQTTKQITALTLTANTGQSISSGATSLGANASVSYIYRLASTTWFPYSSGSSLPGVLGQAFTTAGSGQTFTIPSGVTALKVTVVAGGAAGGASNSSPKSVGGGAGGSAVAYLTGLTPGNTLSVTVGAAAGASSVASGTQTISTVSATAGTAGASGGAGGSGSGGSINVTGSSGQQPASAIGGNGAGSIFGTGGTGGNGVNGNAAVNYGAGGGGGGSGCGVTSGGAGYQGVVIFEW